ncbi:MAG: hypothetical protein ACPK7O_09035 [Methanobacterium sp.]
MSDKRLEKAVRYYVNVPKNVLISFKAFVKAKNREEVTFEEYEIARALIEYMGRHNWDVANLRFKDEPEHKKKDNKLEFITAYEKQKR